MIMQISKVDLPEIPLLSIELAVDKKSITYDGRAALTVTILNHSKEPVELYQRGLRLDITVHKRGTLPGKKVEQDAIFDCFNDPYYGGPGLEYMRATINRSLFTDKGNIIMKNGEPVLCIQKGNETKQADIYDEDKRTVEPDKSVSFPYQIGDGWLVNEYEFQVCFRSQQKSNVNLIRSKPISFDVNAPVPGNPQENTPVEKQGGAK
ncbi:MAG: hypothetical protein V1701_02270 [Planctomycetota bacterium]